MPECRIHPQRIPVPQPDDDRLLPGVRTTIPEFVTPTSGVVFYLLDDPQAFRNIYLSYSRNKTSPIHRQLIEFMRGESPGKNWSRR